jgi:hypothetical protein
VSQNEDEFASSSISIDLYKLMIIPD